MVIRGTRPLPGRGVGVEGVGKGGSPLVCGAEKADTERRIKLGMICKQMKCRKYNKQSEA